MRKQHGVWVGLHTSPNVDPHATLVWRNADESKQAALLHLVKGFASVLNRPIEAWVDTYEQFGVRRNIDVAILQPDHRLDYMVDVFSKYHESEWPIRPHVTAHEGRQTFTFSYLALHTPWEHRYFKFGVEED